MTSVLRCGDDGCPCRNLPDRTDQGDTERLRAENAELRARLAGLRELADSEAVRGNEAEAKVARVAALVDDWRYKGEFGWGPWQIGEGPDQEGYVLDQAATLLRQALAGEADQ